LIAGLIDARREREMEQNSLLWKQEAKDSFVSRIPQARSELLIYSFQLKMSPSQ
jgi:hypothetical protein